MFEPLMDSVVLFDCIFTSISKHGLLKHFGTAEVLGIVFSAMSFKIEMDKDMGSSASVMSNWCR